MDDVTEERIDDILFNFDFMKVADTRKYLKLNIQTMDDDEKFELMKTAKRLLKTAVSGALKQKEDYHCATGGFDAIAYYHDGDIHLRLVYILEEWYSEIEKNRNTAGEIMTREDFIDLLEFRDFILERADMLIDAGFSIDSAVLNNFYETANGIVSRMEQNLKLGKIAGNYTVLSWALESLDAGHPFTWEIEGKKYKGHDFADLWRHMQEEIRSKGKK